MNCGPFYAPSLIKNPVGPLVIFFYIKGRAYLNKPWMWILQEIPMVYIIHHIIPYSVSLIPQYVLNLASPAHTYGKQVINYYVFCSIFTVKRAMMMTKL